MIIFTFQGCCDIYNDSEAVGASKALKNHTYYLLFSFLHLATKYFERTEKETDQAWMSYSSSLELFCFEGQTPMV